MYAVFMLLAVTASLLVLAGTIAFYWLALVKPQLFDEGSRDWRLEVLAAMAVVGTGLCIFAGVQKIAWWLPESWEIEHNMSVRMWGGLLAACYLGVLLPLGTSKLATRVTRLEKANAELRELIQRINI
ncbi:hypothetical protein [Bradyrhizobium sp. SZCCHNRI2049]|uniref:hypothetical protein n=1 Tax=Bradyrhizobium sp. SZCCHNRI2049 TaxID=3057287 RepID=UPI0029167009|nr:hypothetical protein [Bradyrhizobium sp. SZCCHNRI2049]